MDLMDAIAGRHTVWHFQPRCVEEDKLRAIIDAARWAPSGGNMQPWDFVVVTDPTLKHQMAELIKLAHARWMTEAVMAPRHKAEIEGVQANIDAYTPSDVVFINVCMSFKQYYVPGRQPKPEYIREMNFQSIGAAVQTLLLAATANGLGSHWVGCMCMVQRELNQLLCVPETSEIVATLVVGYPATDSSVRGGQAVERVRNPMDEVAHFNSW